MPLNIDPSSLREGLRFLWFANEIGIDRSGAVDLVSVVRLCRDRAGISSFSPNPMLGIRFLVDAGLAQETDGAIRLTQVGLTIAGKAREPIILNDAQRECLLEHLMTDKRWSERLRGILTHFRVDESGRLAFVKPLYELDEEQDGTLTLLQLMQVIRLDGEDLILGRDAVKFLADYMYSWLPISQLELDKIIAERKRLADMAEEYVVDWEKRRLEHVGFPQLCSLVSRVSETDVSRGYDLHSVDGEHGSDRDRYIEVKSSIGENLAFYWTAREMEVAEQRRDQYWIYFVPCVHLLPKVCTIHAIQDPIRFKDTLLELSLASAFVKGERLVQSRHCSYEFTSGFRGLAWTLDIENSQRESPSE